MNKQTETLKNGDPILVDLDEAEFISRKGAWTTYLDQDGRTKKARNSRVAALNPKEEAKPAGPQEVSLSEALAEDAEDEQAEDGDEVRTHRIVKAKYDPRRYHKFDAVTESGRHKVDTDDKVARRLRSTTTLAEVYQAVATDLAACLNKDPEELEQELLNKYGHLNPGMQRMNLGNRLRKYL